MASISSNLEGKIQEEFRAIRKSLDKRLEKKKDASVIDVELEFLKDSNDKNNSKVDEALSRVGTHNCHRSKSIIDMKDGLNKMQKTLDNWRALKAGSFVAIVIAILSGAWFIFEMKSETVVVKSQVAELKDDVVSIRNGNDRLEKSFQAMKERKDRKYEEILDGLSLISTKIDNRPSRDNVRNNRKGRK